jgi:hypothetical protein
VKLVELSGPKKKKREYLKNKINELEKTVRIRILEIFTGV